MRRAALIVSAVIALALPQAAVGASPPARSAHTASAGGWSAARMAAAPALDLVRGGHGIRTRFAHPVPFASAEVTDPATYPNSTNGRLFGRINGLGDYSCSATVLDTANGRVVFTAGHCVYEPQLGRFAKQLTFVPAYSDGNAPFGAWSWTSLVTTRGWVGGNPNFDYAAIKLAKVNGMSIETAVGGGRVLKTKPLRSQSYAAFGYPANMAAGERMWSCASGYAGKDPRPFPVGKAASAIGCDMTAGASGGGWVGASGRLVSLSSFGYAGQPNIVYGPYLTGAAREIVKRLGS
jgi:hypothetical protein